MAGNALLHHLLVILLSFSLLMSLNAAVTTPRASHLLHQSQDFLASEKTNQMNREEIVEEDKTSRMDLEVHDYNPGANTHHTPKLPPGMF
ncbi:hypothetical protein ACSBR2_006464 [Camellia fascicularis]